MGECCREGWPGEESDLCQTGSREKCCPVLTDHASSGSSAVVAQPRKDQGALLRLQGYPGRCLASISVESTLQLCLGEQRTQALWLLSPCVLILRKNVLFFSYHFLVPVSSWFLTACNHCPSAEISFRYFFPGPWSFSVISKVIYKFLGKSFIYNKHFFSHKVKGVQGLPKLPEPYQWTLSCMEERKCKSFSIEKEATVICCVWHE